MKKLISAKTIRQAYDAGNLRIEIEQAESIITPQAQTTAEQLGVELVEIKSKTETKVSYSDYQKIVKQVSDHFPGGKYSKAKIEKAVKDVLSGEKK